MLDDDLLTFIQGSFPSVWALEAMLLLRRERERSWTAEALARELRANDRIVAEQLASLEAAGLVVCTETCAYQPAAPVLDTLCGRTEDAYRDRPAQVVRAIMSRPNDKLQIFADAFRFRGDGK